MIWNIKYPLPLNVCFDILILNSILNSVRLLFLNLSQIISGENSSCAMIMDSWPIVKDGAKWNLHWNFNSLNLSYHTWNISMKCPSRIYKQWKSDWYVSCVCFMCEKPELRCWNFWILHWLLLLFQHLNFWLLTMWYNGSWFIPLE